MRTRYGVNDGSTEHADWCFFGDHEGKCLDRLLEHVGVEPTPWQGRIADHLLDEKNDDT